MRVAVDTVRQDGQDVPVIVLNRAALDRSSGFDAKAIFIAWRLPLRGLPGIARANKNIFTLRMSRRTNARFFVFVSGLPARLRHSFLGCSMVASPDNRVVQSNSIGLPDDSSDLAYRKIH